MTDKLIPRFGPGDPSNVGVRGLEAAFEFNGVKLHDRIISEDCYWVSDVGGLDDADLRDTREVNPSDHGEVPYDLFYGGRTITFTGSIIAGNLEKLRGMERDLKTAFSTTVEQDLKMRYYDWADDFSVNTLPFYVFDSGASSNALVNGSLSIPGAPTTEHRLIRTTGIQQLYNYEDGQIVMVVNPGSVAASFKAGVILKRIDASNYIEAYIQNNAGTWQYRIDKVVATVRTNLAYALATTPVISTTFYLRTKLDRNTVTIERFSSSPGRTTTSVDTILTYNLAAGAEQTTFGTGVRAKYGIVFNPQSSASYIDDVALTSASSLYDIKIACRKGASVSIKEGQNSRSSLKREFLITLRASSPFFKSTYLDKKPVSTQTYTNLIANPSFETDVSIWNGVANGPIGLTSTLARSTAQFNVGTASLAVTTPGGANTQGALYNFGTLQSGQTVSAGVWIRVPSTQIMNIALEDNSLGNGIVTASQSITLNTWTRMTLTWTPTALSTNACLYIYTNSGAAAQTFFVDAVIVNLGFPVLTYFDGNSTSASWDGTTNLSTSTLYPEGSALALSSYARSYNKTYPFYYNKFINSSGSVISSGNDLAITNNGNFDSKPVIRLNGPLLNPSVKNQTNGQVIYLTGTVASNDWIEIDIANKTIVDSLGANRFAMLSPNSDWLVISPGVNTVSLYTQTGSGNAVIWWNHTWI